MKYVIRLKKLIKHLGLKLEEEYKIEFLVGFKDVSEFEYKGRLYSVFGSGLIGSEPMPAE